MNNRFKTALKWIVDLILTFIGFTLLENVNEMISIESIKGIAGILSIIGATALTTYLLLEWRKKSTTVDTRFTHLTVHYSQRIDNPDIEKPARPYYVTNSRTNQAYWVSDLLEPYVRQHKIDWFSHDGEKALRDYFKKQGININDAKPRQPEDLGLHVRRDGVLQLLDLDLVRLLTKLGGRKIDDVKILKLYPWHRHYRTRPFYTNKRLLLKQSTREVFLAPFHDLELIDREMIDYDNKCRKPFETLKGWSKRQGYAYNDRRYTESELLGG